MNRRFRRLRKSIAAWKNERPKFCTWNRTLKLEHMERRNLLATTPIEIVVENLADDSGLHLTPFWTGFHDGGFEIGRGGASAGSFGGLEELAEEGNTAPISTRFQTADPTWVDAIISAPGGFGPVLEPGESIRSQFSVSDAESNRYFSYASMVIPSNDAFIANLNPLAYEIFDGAGRLIRTRTIEIYGNQIWDAGTEVNDSGGGAAFSTEGGTSVSEDEPIRLHSGLDDFVGTGIASGGNLAAAFMSQTPIARITITSAENPVGPLDANGPSATLQASDLTSTGPTHAIEIVYTDASGVDVSSIDIGDIRIDGESGAFLPVVGVTTDAAAGTNPKTVTATYTVAPTGGFSPNWNGNYRVNLAAQAVRDVAINASESRTLGSFRVDVPVELDVTIENLSPAGGLAQTPYWLGFHDGSFELGRLGEAAAGFGGLEEIAEEGETGGLATRFGQEQPSGVELTVASPAGQAPVFEPGEVVTRTLEIHDSNVNRYLSYASMIIPSNDAFLANLNSRAIQLFDSAGEFLGPRSIVIYGRNVWDAGTEVNNPTGGAAFSTGGGTSVDENGVIHVHLGLDDFVGTELPIGSDLLSAFDGNTPLARITIRSTGGAQGPVDDSAPQSELSAATVTASGSQQHTLQVTYTDPSGVDTSRIGIDDLRIGGTRGRFLRVTGVTTDAVAGTNPNTVTATYTVEPASGPFTFDYNGFYQVFLQNRTVRDLANNISSERLLGEVEVRVGVQLKVTVENLAVDGGLAQTPYWIGIHQGDFDLGNSGESASNFGGLEELAEDGNATPLRDRFATQDSGAVDGVVLAPDGFSGAPVFEPGEVASLVIDVTSPDQNRFFSYASMVIPSNDAFIANLDPRAIELFNPLGEFHGPRTIEIFGRDVYDAGTEVNNPTGGAAFSTGGGDAVDENGNIARHAGLDDFVGTGLPTGQNLNTAFDAVTPISRVTVCLDDGTDNPCTPRPSQGGNQFDPRDVNEDGVVSALDALLIINFINNQNDGGNAEGTDLLDVQGDGEVGAMDALLVVNHINQSTEPLASLASAEAARRRDQSLASLFGDD